MSGPAAFRPGGALGRAADEGPEVAFTFSVPLACLWFADQPRRQPMILRSHGTSVLDLGVISNRTPLLNNRPLPSDRAGTVMNDAARLRTMVAAPRRRA